MKTRLPFTLNAPLNPWADKRGVWNNTPSDNLAAIRGLGLQNGSSSRNGYLFSSSTNLQQKIKPGRLPDLQHKSFTNALLEAWVFNGNAIATGAQVGNKVIPSFVCDNGHRYIGISLLILTRAPLITASLFSVMTPAMEPVSVCAIAIAANNPNKNTLGNTISETLDQRFLELV
jgi:hypothetical protein